MGDPLKHVPEKLKTEGIFVHHQERVHAGDTVEAIRNVAGCIKEGTRLRIADVFVEPNGNQRGFEKRLCFSEFPDDDFNPKRFRKVKDIADPEASAEYALILETLIPQAQSSHDNHHCPDLSPLLPAIAKTVADLTNSHPSLQIELKYNDAAYRAFCDGIADALQQVIRDDLFDGFRGQKRFLVHMWSGILAVVLWDHCMKMKEEK